MLDISKTILEKYQVRKTKKQKTEFINFLQDHYPNQFVVEEGGFAKNRNIIFGDIEKADIILTAHYDTQAVLPFPNFLTPKNIFIYILYSVLVSFVFVAIPMFLFDMIVISIFNNPVIIFISNYLILIFFFWMLMFGIDNKHTANDNTSGVITLLEAMNIDEIKEKAAFVFFDNEELGMLGSAFFNKKYKNELKDKLIINFDCVSDGNYIMFVYNKHAKKYKNTLETSFISDNQKEAIITSSKTTFYPSDQMNFKTTIAVAAFNKNKFLGYYVDKIHTNKDTVFDENNINFIVDGLKTFCLQNKTMI